MLSLPELERAVALIDRDLRGAKVGACVEARPRELQMVLRGAEGRRDAIHFCVEPGRARCLLDVPRATEGISVSPFCELLRARLKGQRLRSAALRGRDRLAAFAFDNECVLLLAVMGSRSNLLLLDDEERVLGALRPLSETHRDLRPGATWRAPTTAAPREGVDRFADLDDDAWWEAMRAHYSGAEHRAEEDALERRVAKALRKARQNLEKKRGLLEGDARAGDEALRLRRDGERLKSVVGQLEPGAREARGVDFETGEAFCLELDPSESPRAALQGFFAKARKAEKRAARAGAGLAELEDRDRALGALEREFAARKDNPAGLATLAEEPEMEALLRRYAAAPASPKTRGAKAATGPVFRVGKRELPRRLWPRRYRSRDGLEIWVGRSDEGNDLLSTRLARGKDLFFHLDAAPGSHVILRTEGRSDPPSDSLLDAAELAVHFSKARNATRADVHIAPARLVRKPKGAKAGLVSVGGGRSLHLRRDPSRLERVLASRIEEGAS